MSRLEWGKVGDRLYETGVDRGVLYPELGPGVVWNGLVSVNEEASGGELESFYFDGVKYLDVVANEDFQATIEAFSAPAEFAACEGSKMLSPGLFATQQPRKTFGMSWRTLIGNDLRGTEHGYKLHIVYGATVAPSSRSYKTISSDSDLETRQWTISTVPPPANLYKPTAHFVLDSTKIDPYLLENVETLLYGNEDLDPVLISQPRVIEVLANRITEPIAATI